MVAWDVEQRDVEPADEVFEVVERQIATPEHQVRIQPGQAVAIERFVDLVGDGEDARLVPGKTD